MSHEVLSRRTTSALGTRGRRSRDARTPGFGGLDGVVNERTKKRSLAGVHAQELRWLLALRPLVARRAAGEPSPRPWESATRSAGVQQQATRASLVKTWREAKEREDADLILTRALSSAREADRLSVSKLSCTCGAKGLRYVEAYTDEWLYRPKAVCPKCRQEKQNWWL